MLLPAGSERAWSGNYVSFAAATLKAPVEGIRSVPIEIVWSRDGSAPSHTVHFNASAQRVSPLSQIAAVHISNLHSTVPVRLLFPDTGFEIELGIGLEGFYPVVTNGLEFLAYVPLTPAGGDACTIQVLNFLPPPVLNGGTASGGGGVGVLRIDSGPGLTGGPVTDVGTLSLDIPVAVSSGGTGAVTQDQALDALVGAAGAQTGMIARDAAGAWNLEPIPNGSGPILPLVVGQGGTGATTGFLGLDNLSQAGTQTGALRRAANGAWSLSPTGTGTVTNVLPGTGLQGGGTGPTVTLGLISPVPVNLGGTGSTTAAGALALLGAAPTDSPAFSGTPTAPTPAPGDSDTSIATIAFVNNAISGGVGGYLPLSGGTLSGSLAVNSTTALNGRLTVHFPDDSGAQFLAAGTTYGIRILTAADRAELSAVTQNLGAFAPLTIAGSTIRIANNTTISGGLAVTGNTIALSGTGPVLSFDDTDTAQGNAIWTDTGALNFGHATAAGAPDALWASIAASNAAFYGGMTVSGALTVSGNEITISGTGPVLNFVDTDAGQANAVWADAGTLNFGHATGGIPDTIWAAIGTNGTATHYGNVRINSPTQSALNLYSPNSATNVNLTMSLPGVKTYVLAVDTSGFWGILDNTAGAWRLQIDANGNCSNRTGSWTAISDATLKQDVQLYKRGLDAILNLNPVAFRYVPGTPFTTRDEPSRVLYGLIADEVLPYIPEVCGETTISVNDEEQTVLTLQTGDLVYTLINAVKELSSRLERLEAQLKPAGSTH